MASISTILNKGGNKTYRARIKIHGYDLSKTFPLMKQARQWAQNKEAEIINNMSNPVLNASRYKISDMINRFIEYELPKRPKVWNNWKGILIVWRGLIGKYYLADVKTPVLIAARDTIHKERGLSNSTVNKYLIVLTCVFNVAIRDWEWVTFNPMQRVKKLKEGQMRDRYLSDDERKRLFTAAQESKNKYIYTIIMLALSTGARKGEIITLRWADVDFKHKIIILSNTKNGEKRSLIIINDVFLCLEKLYKSKQSVWVFPNKNKNNHLNVDKVFNDIKITAKIDNFRFHDLRHTTASYLAMNNVSLNQIAEVLGHKSLSMSKRYSHFSNESKKAVVDKLDVLLK